MMGTQRLLVVEDDSDILANLLVLLEDVGYQVTGVPLLDEALSLLDHETFDLILSDLFATVHSPGFESVTPLFERAYPTPVGILTARRLDADVESGARFIMSKPFDIDDLLGVVASALATPLAEEEEPLARLVNAYFAVISARNWDGLADLCTDDVVYHVPDGAPRSTEVRGKSAFRAYSESVFSRLPMARFDNIHIYPHPTGLVARYLAHWQSPDDQDVHQNTGSVFFRFTDELISQIGIRVNNDTLIFA